MTDTAEQPPQSRTTTRTLTADVRVPERIELGETGFHLRRLIPGDARAVHDAIVAGFAEIHRWMPWCTEPVELEDQRQFVERSIADWERASAFNLGVFDAEGRLGGMVSLMDRIDPGGLETGYWLRTDVTGRGVITAAVRALTDIALALPGVTHVEVHCDAANVRSAAVPRRLGFRLAREVPREIEAPAESGTEQHWVTP
jgi:RimJ/RimL family protein N-acetyltransferase